MRRVGAQDEGGLQEKLVHPSGAPAVIREVEVAAAVRALRVLVAQAEAQELGGIVREERTHGPFLTRVDRVLGPVVAEAQEPLRELAVGEGSHIRADVEALAVAMSRLVDPVGVCHEDVAEREQVLSVGREERALPSRGRELVLHVEADDGARLLLRRVTVGDGRAELDGAEVPKVEEGADATSRERVPERVSAKGDLVLAIEDAAEDLQVKGEG